MKWVKLLLAIVLILAAGVNLYRKIDRLFAEDHWLPEQKSDRTPVRSTLGAGALLVAAGWLVSGSREARCGRTSSQETRLNDSSRRTVPAALPSIKLAHVERSHFLASATASAAESTRRSPAFLRSSKRITWYEWSSSTNRDTRRSPFSAEAP